jgi:hypothetical protein
MGVVFADCCSLAVAEKPVMFDVTYRLRNKLPRLHHPCLALIHEHS